MLRVDGREFYITCNCPIENSHFRTLRKFYFLAGGRHRDTGGSKYLVKAYVVLKLKNLSSMEESSVKEKRRQEHNVLRLRRREVTNIDQDIKNFRKALFLQGLDIRPVKDDGNCLFRAAADQIVGNERFHAQIREQVCDYIALHSDYLKDFVEDNNTVEEYLREMRCDGTWAGNMEVCTTFSFYG